MSRVGTVPVWIPSLLLVTTKATKQVLSQRNANPQATASVAVSMVPSCAGVATMLVTQDLWIDTKFLIISPQFLDSLKDTAAV